MRTPLKHALIQLESRTVVIENRTVHHYSVSDLRLIRQGVILASAFVVNTVYEQLIAFIVLDITVTESGI